STFHTSSVPHPYPLSLHDALPIFGTLFERTLDPAKRAQIGAHYTSRQDIETLLTPVLLDPLRREWHDVKASAEKFWDKVMPFPRSEEHTSELQSPDHLVCRLLLEK